MDTSMDMSKRQKVKNKKRNDELKDSNEKESKYEESRQMNNLDKGKQILVIILAIFAVIVSNSFECIRILWNRLLHQIHCCYPHSHGIHTFPDKRSINRNIMEERMKVMEEYEKRYRELQSLNDKLENNLDKLFTYEDEIESGSYGKVIRVTRNDSSEPRERALKLFKTNEPHTMIEFAHLSAPNFNHVNVIKCYHCWVEDRTKTSQEWNKYIAKSMPKKLIIMEMELCLGN